MSEYLEKTRRKSTGDTDRLPPHSPDMEQALLANVVCGLTPTENNTAINECCERGLAPDWFYDARHQLIWWAISDAHKRGMDVDVLMLVQWLRDSDNLEKCGGYNYVTGELMAKATGSSMVSYYLDSVQEKYRRRQLIRAGMAAVSTAFEESLDLAEVLADAEKAVLSINEASAAQKERSAKELMPGVIDDLEDYHRGSAQIRGLTLGLEYLDKMLCGIGGEENNMIVIGARPGMGKTALALGIALHASLDYTLWQVQKDATGKAQSNPDGSYVFAGTKGVPVGIFSLEMTAKALMKRLIFQRSEADAQRWRTGMAVTGDIPRLMKAAEEIGKAPIYIDDSGRMTIDELRARARRMVRQLGVKLFIVDYIQLMRVAGRQHRDDRVQELSEISGEFQKLGKELGVPFIVLAQLNRDVEKDPNRKPRLSDLKDCGAIEQDADVVAFLYEPKKWDEDEEYLRAMDRVFGDDRDWSKRPARVDLLLCKSRNGPTGNCQLLFHKSCGRFHDWNRWLKEHGLKNWAKGETQAPVKHEQTDLPEE